MMFESRKKIRRLNDELNQIKKTPELEQVADAIMANKPAEADPVYTKNLRNKLLEKHQYMTKHNKQVKVEQLEKGENKKSFFDLFRQKGLAVALGLVAIVLVAGLISYPLIPAPTVQGYVLKNSVREISVNAPFKLTFSQLMDNASVEKNFVIEPAITGKFNWSGNTLNFVPDQARKIGETYKITIGKGAQSLLRKPMTSEYSEYYKLVKSPEISLMTPNDKANEVAVDTKITVMFDRPMVEFTTLENGEGKIPDIKIEPAINGRFKWLGTSALQFIPENGLKLSTTYKVTVPAGVVALDGGVTEKEFITSFDTVRPMAWDFKSTDGNNTEIFSVNSRIKLNFNQKVNLDSAKQLIVLQTDNGAQTEKVDFDVRYFTEQDYRDENKRAGELVEMNQTEQVKEEIAPGTGSTVPKEEMPKAEELEKSLYITPKVALKNGAAYALLVYPGVLGVEGNLGSKDQATFSFKVNNQFAFEKGELSDYGNGDSPYVKLHFNTPIDLRSLKNKVHITPVSKDAEGKDAEVGLSINEEATVSYDYKPSTNYKMMIDPGVKNIFGEVYNQTINFDFTTPALKSDMELKSGSDITVVDGSKPSVFYVKSVNIDKVNVRLKKLSESEFNKYYGRGFVNNEERDKVSNADFTELATLPINLKFNERGFTKLDLDAQFGRKLEPGFYFLRVNSEKVKDENNLVVNNDQILVISRSNLAVKSSTKQMVVWATDMAEGKPVAGMKIRVIKDSDSGKKSEISGVTDNDGIAKIDLTTVADTQNPYVDYTVIGEKDGDMAFNHTTWSDGVAPWNFNINYEAAPAEYYSYLYTDRPVYRPAQEVFFKGILRRDTSSGFKLPEVKEVSVVITDANGTEIYNKTQALSNNGTFNGSVQLGDNIAIGDYSIQATLLGYKGSEWNGKFFGGFKVYEYKKPDYKMDISSEKKEYVNGETAKVKLNAGYFFGAPLPNAEVKWTVKAADYYFILPETLAAKLNGSWFSFAEDGFFCYWGCQSSNELVSQGVGKTDAQGNYEFILPLQIGDKKMSQLYTVEATVSDANNQSVSNRTSIPVHQGETYVGIRSTDYVLDSSKPAKFDVLTVKPSGEILKGTNVEVALYKRDWNTVKRKNVDSGFYYENNYDDKLIEKKNVSTGDEGLGSVEFNLKDGGSYKVEASLKDSKGNTVKSSTTVYVGSGDFINWGSQNNDKLELVTDKTEYKVGDIAKVMVKSPYRNVYALVTYEKDRVLDQKVVKLDSNSQVIEVPVTENFLPNAYVSVVLVKGDRYDAGLIEPVAGDNDERQVAAFKVGYATLQVNTSGKKLNIDIKSDKTVYGPKDKVKLALKTTDSSGKPVSAELSVGVVDESVLSLTESVTADLLNVFYRQRTLGVAFSETLTKAISRVNVAIEAGLKGGGGSGLAKRGVFKDTAHFEAVLKTNVQGEGTLEFELPDNLTSWQVLAIGITDDSKGGERTLVGSNKYTFVVNKDVLVRPALPRFLTAGDEMTVSAMVHNYTDSDQNVRVELKAEGVDVTDGISRDVGVKAKSAEKVAWKIKVGNGLAAGDTAKFDFKAMAGAKGDEIEQTLKIHQANFPSYVATSKVITGDTKEIDQVWLPLGLDRNFGKLSVSINPTLAGTINQGLEYLMTYPYGCSEQLASAILPNLALKHLVEMSKFDTKAIDKNTLKKNVEAGLQGIYKNQHPDGGFGLWAESEPNEWVTAYVLNTFNLADANGYTVDKNAMAMAADYLKKKMVMIPIDKDSSVANTRAYVLFVLSEIKQGDLGLMNNLDGSRNLLSLSSKAYLAMAYQDMMDQNKIGADKNAVTGKIETLKKELENAAKQTERGVTFEDQIYNYRLFESNTSATALVLKALNRIDAENPLIPKILEALLKEKQGGGHYASTQETAVTLLALIEYLEKSKELSPAYEGVVTMNGQELIKKSFTSANVFENATKTVNLKDMLADNLDNEIAVQKTGKGKMYVDMNLEYYLPLEKLNARNEGIEVSQEYFSLDDKKMEHPLTEAKVGQNLKAKMTVVVPEERNYVMVEDYLPAGLEGIDFNLKTSEQNLDEKADCGWYCKADWYFTHSEVHDDRVMYWADYLPKGVYEIEYYVRPTSVGSFADLPAMAQETYFPEVFGRSAGRILKITQ